MYVSKRIAIVLLPVLAAGLAGAPVSMAAKEKSGEVVSTSVPFQAGEVVPDLEHNILKISSMVIHLGDPDPKSGKQKVDLKMRVENFGEKDHKVILTATLRDEGDSIVAARTVKDDIDDNDREVFKAKFTLPQTEVARVKSVQLEVSYLPD